MLKASGVVVLPAIKEVQNEGATPEVKGSPSRPSPKPKPKPAVPSPLSGPKLPEQLRALLKVWGERMGVRGGPVTASRLVSYLARCVNHPFPPRPEAMLAAKTMLNRRHERVTVQSLKPFVESYSCKQFKASEPGMRT